MLWSENVTREIDKFNYNNATEVEFEITNLKIEGDFYSESYEFFILNNDKGKVKINGQVKGVFHSDTIISFNYNVNVENKSININSLDLYTRIIVENIIKEFMPRI